jgi:hypothetical protein
MPYPEHAASQKRKNRTSTKTSDEDKVCKKNHLTTKITRGVFDRDHVNDYCN